jgi:two-component system cell cycle response regulator DivK
MAGEPILIVDDTPVNLKLTRILLVNEGYKVMTAASAEEALELLRSYHPQLILADIQLPGIDGLELTRRIKKNVETRDITVVALTAFAMKGDEQKAVEAGCDGYITKPIDTRSLGARIREHLNRRAEAQGTPAAAAPIAAAAGAADAASLPAAEMLALRRKFLTEGQEAARQMLLDLDGQFNATEAAKKIHNWIGTGGLLGYTAISRLAREAEAVLLVRPLENDQLRDSLTNLALAFNSPREARDAPLSESIVHALSGKRVALVGLPASDAQRMCVALERTNSVPVFFEASEPPDSKAVLECHLAVVHVRPEMGQTPWLEPGTAYMLPLVFVGNRDHLLSLDQNIQALACEFLMDSWQPEEALVRLSLALSQQRVSVPQKPPAGMSTSERTRVVIADDDPTVLALVRTALANFGMECYTSVDGPAALETIRRYRPHAAVLDVNMPGMDGYEVLSAVRAEEIPVRILLLTARQQESDVIRGFTLGADDYVVKPFSPMELVARMKRLLWR